MTLFRPIQQSPLPPSPRGEEQHQNKSSQCQEHSRSNYALLNKAPFHHLPDLCRDYRRRLSYSSRRRSSSARASAIRCYSSRLWCAALSASSSAASCSLTRASSLDSRRMVFRATSYSRVAKFPMCLSVWAVWLSSCCSPLCRAATSARSPVSSARSSS